MTTYFEEMTGSTDDAFENSLGNTTTNGTSILLDEEDEWGFWRFQDVGDIDGATINTAEISFWFVSNTQDEPDITIWGQAADNAAAATAGSGNLNISSRPRTTASVAWDSADLGVGVSGEDVFSPELETIVQEQADNGYLASGYIAFVATSTNGTGTRDFQVGTFDAGGAQIPALHVDYTAAGGGGGTQQMLTLLGCGA